MSSTEPRLPIVALTMGDVAGVGPEVLVRACQAVQGRNLCRPVIVGDADVFSRAAALVGGETLNTVPCEAVECRDRAASAEAIPIWNPATTNVADVKPGGIDGRAGRAAYDWLVGATRETLAGTFDAIVTAPLNKAALHAAGLNYPGHTEILGEECGVSDFAMMLYLPAGDRVRGPFGLGVAHVTLHTSIASVPGLLSRDGVASRIGLMDRFLKRMGCPQPRIGVCALNPHAGEEGLFGDEETRIIAPAVASAREQGCDALGPLPADTLLHRAVGGAFDGIVAMYHDQGHIALKLIGFDVAVNITLGLPIVRTSPSHGTAFDIAWRGEASVTGMLGAIEAAVQLAQHREIQDAGTDV